MDITNLFVEFLQSGSGTRTKFIYTLHVFHYTNQEYCMLFLFSHIPVYQLTIICEKFISLS